MVVSERQMSAFSGSSADSPAATEMPAAQVDLRREFNEVGIG